MSSFELDEQIRNDTIPVCELSLCTVVLHKDANYPWLLLIPMRNSIREIHELSDEQQLQLMREISQVAKALQSHCNADKMNVAALGNMVPQLHIHIVARYFSDKAWPGPIWGAAKSTSYEPDQGQVLASQLAKLLR